MNTLVPLEYYAQIFYYFLLVICLYVYSKSITTEIDDDDNIKSMRVTGMLLVLVVVLYMGLRPVSGVYFGDMITYSNTFQIYRSGQLIDFVNVKDIWWDRFMFACAQIMSGDAFFFLCTLLYVIPLFFASRRIFGEYWPYCFLILIASFSFWTYGTNGIRNGIATSLFIWAASQNKATFTALILLAAALIHKSLLIPIVAYVVTYFHKDTKHYLWVWALAIPASLIAGGFWENFFLNMGLFDDHRLESYFNGADDLDVELTNTGFRWDFLLYSFTGVYAGWYFIVKKGFEDALYSRLYHVYLLVNAFWVLVIRVNYSNRFAYLSWFMLGIIIAYPMLKLKFFDRQHAVFGKILMAYYLFSFIMAVILG